MKPSLWNRGSLSLKWVWVVLLALCALIPMQASCQTSAVVIVYGSTPGGVCAAIAAAREGVSVILIEPTAHIGGMNTGGLSFSDSNQMYRDKLMGLFHEWHLRVQQDYESRGIVLPYDVNVKDQADWSFEPQVAMRVTTNMLAEAGVTVLTGRHLQAVNTTGARIDSIVTADGTFSARVFIDGSYEGDLMAAAGVSWTIGREGTADFGETLAGKQYVTQKPTMNINGFDSSNSPLPLITATNAGPTDDGDDNIMAYSFRLAMTTSAGNKMAVPAPAAYDPARFEVMRRYVQAGGTSVGYDKYLVPGNKIDGNNGIFTQFSLGLVGGAKDWATTNEAGRAAIFEAHKQYTLEFLYFLANDPVFTSGERAAAAQWGLCKDEFTGTGYWPPQLYVRESRRMQGMFVITQNDIISSPFKPDPIMISSFPIDSHDCQRVVLPDGKVVNEGTIYQKPANNNNRGYAYHVPYRAILPQSAECDNLLVPVALSCTHVAMCSLRIEATWMLTGQSAGIAAALAATNDVAVQDLPYADIRPRLLAQGQVLNITAVPVALPQSVTTTRDTPVTITLTGSDPEGSSLTYTVVTDPAHGTLTGAGAVRTYMPDTNYFGADSFTFTVNDGDGDSTPGTVSITVRSCDLIAPTNDSIFTAPASITLQAYALSASGTIVRVEFFGDATLLGEDTNSPYECIWSNVMAGVHTLTARATDDLGAMATSRVVEVVVNGTDGCVTATGGKVKSYTQNGTNFLVHVFTNSGTFTVTGGGTVEYLVVGGGGSGGRSSSGPSGGGGAGALKAGSTNVTATNYSITIGTGGAGRTSNGGGNNGQNSTGLTVVAVGGGGGGGASINAKNGGCGGGGGGSASTNGASGSVGEDGGPSSSTADGSGGGGGGGMGGMGGAGTTTKGGDGGDGMVSTFADGTNVYYCGGGGGYDATETGAGGLGGGGGGGVYNATANTGGGGAGRNGNTSGAGGSGIVIIRYAVGVDPGDDPACTLTVPTNGATFVAPASITLSADASSASGTIARVEFFNGAILLGEDTTSPYAYTWGGVATGSYALTARAADDVGAMKTSAVVNVTVVGSGGGVLATGGVVTNYTENGTNFTAHIFTGVGSTNITFSADITVSYLVVAGGGGGGGRRGGGGGGGGLLTGSTNVTATSYPITVGGGGRGALSSDAINSKYGRRGTNSVFDGITATGGGGGCEYNGGADKNGGSGGGGSGNNNTTRGTGIVGQGKDGGTSAATTNAGAGGGGAGVAGTGGSAGNGGNGGNGAPSSLASGVAIYYAGGGGGGGDTNCVGGAGGSGGGGHGGDNKTNANMTAGTDGLGGGGGAMYSDALNAARGGSGIVIIRYVTVGGGNTDTDGDGILDSVDPDDDNDGMSDVDEATAGTNSKDAGSVLAMSASGVNLFQPNEFVVRWWSVSNKLYTLQAATNLMNGFNLIRGSNILATPPENVHTDSVESVEQRFYRVKLETGN